MKTGRERPLTAAAVWGGAAAAAAVGLIGLLVAPAPDALSPDDLDRTAGVAEEPNLRQAAGLARADLQGTARRAAGRLDPRLVRVTGRVLAKDTEEPLVDSTIEVWLGGSASQRGRTDRPTQVVGVGPGGEIEILLDPLVADESCLLVQNPRCVRRLCSVKSPTAGETVVLGDVRLERGRPVRGTIRFRGQQPVRAWIGIQCQGLWSDNPTREWRLADRVQENGHFELGPIPYGYHRLDFICRELRLASPVWILVANGDEPLQVELEVESRDVVRGTVVDDRGLGIAGASVEESLDEGRPPSIVPTTTDAAGRFAIWRPDGPPTGARLMLRAVAHDHGEGWSDPVGWGESCQIRVGTAGSAWLRISSIGGAVPSTVRIVEMRGVDVFDRDGEQECKVDGQGLVEAVLSSPRTDGVVVTADGFARAGARLRAGGRHMATQVTLERCSTVRVQVIDPEGRPIAGQQVELIACDADDPRAVCTPGSAFPAIAAGITGTSGAITFSGLDARKAYARVSAARGWAAAVCGPILLRPGEVQSVVLSMRMGRSVTVVVQPVHDSWQDWMMRLEQADGPWSLPMDVSRAGVPCRRASEFEATAIPPGEWDVVLVRDWRTPADGKVSIARWRHRLGRITVSACDARAVFDGSALVPGSLEGFVEVDGRMVAAGWVSLVADSSDGTRTVGVSIDDAGHFHFPYVLAGTHRLSWRLPGFLPSAGEWPAPVVVLPARAPG